MFSVLLKPMLLLTVLLAATVVIVQLRPYDDQPLREFLTGPENCDGTCLLGMRVGSTTVKQAMADLEADPWVGSTHLNASGGGYGEIRWQWSGLQPNLIDPNHAGRITFYWDRDETVALDDITINQILNLHVDLYGYASSMVWKALFRHG